MASWINKFFKISEESLFVKAFKKFLRRAKKNNNTNRRMLIAGKKRNPKNRFINKGIDPKF